jgi:hypothetical protein
MTQFAIDVEMPAGWKHDHRLYELLSDALAEADCCWLQGACAVGFLLACVIEGNEDVDYRTAVAGKICQMVMAVARTGEMDGGRMQ